MPHWIPPEAVQVGLTVFLSFLIGLEREEQKARTKAYHFGGVRTYPLLGLTGLMLTKLFPQTFWPVLLGLLAITPFLVTSYFYKLTREQGGFTSEIAAIIAYLSGALVGSEMYWMAAAVVVLNVLLLQAKEGLERLGKKIPSGEIGIFLQFLILTAVLLPIVPNEEFTRFQINPFKTWLVVVAICGISYGSYLLERIFRSRESLFVSALLGGAYSSTATTVVIAKKSKADPDNPVYRYAILASSSLMYARIALLLFLFNRELFVRFGWYFIAVALAGIAVSYCCFRLQSKTPMTAPPGTAILENRNPLEFSTAFGFAVLFVLVSVGTKLALKYFGNPGTYALGVLMGFVDVDVFIVSITQAAADAQAMRIAILGTAVVASSNNAAKGIYAMVFGDRRTGLLSFLYLIVLTLAGLLVLAWA